MVPFESGAGCVIIDTSSILFGLSNRKDVFQAIRYELPGARLLVSRGTIREIRHAKAAAARRSSSAALSLIRVHRVAIANDASHVDSWILHTAHKYGCAVCTNDTGLKAKLRKRGITVFSISRAGTLR